MEEEGRRRGRRRGAGATGFLAGLDEEDEDEDMPMVVQDQDQLMEQHRSFADGRAGQRDQGEGKFALASGVGYPAPGSAVNTSASKERERHKRGGRRAFELQMDNATLLGRRQNAQRDNAMDEM
jgi:hypothetical protein